MESNSKYQWKLRMNKFTKDFQKEFKTVYDKYFSPLSEEDKKKYTAYFYILLTLAAITFFGIFALGPTFNTIGTLNKQYKDNMQILNALDTKLANLKNLDQEYQTIQPNIDQVYSAIPRTTEIPTLTRQLETLAAQNNLSVTGLSFNTVEIYPNSKNDPIFSFLFTITLAGNNQEDINKFISDTVNFDRIVGIEHVSTGRDQEGKYTLSFTGRAFFAPK